MSLRELVELYKSKSGLSQNKIASDLDLSGAMVSQVISGSYKGNKEEVEAKIRKHIEIELSKYIVDKKKEVFIDFEHVIINKAKISNAMRDREFLIIRGESGVGKSELLKHMCKQIPNSVYVEAFKGIRTKGFMYDFALELGIKPDGSAADVFKLIREVLKRKNKVIFLDEVNHLDYTSLEMIRSLWGMTDTAFILAGTYDGISDILRVHEQINSRAKKSHIPVLNEEQTALLMQNYGFEACKKCLALLYGEFGGMLRKTANALKEWREISRGKVPTLESLTYAIEDVA